MLTHRMSKSKGYGDYNTLQQQCMASKSSCPRLKCNDSKEGLKKALQNCESCKRELPETLTLQSTVDIPKCAAPPNGAPGQSIVVMTRPSTRIRRSPFHDGHRRFQEHEAIVERVSRNTQFTGRPVLEQFASDRNQELPPATVYLQGNNQNTNFPLNSQVVPPAAQNVNVLMYGEWKLADMRRQLDNNHLQAPFPALLMGYKQFFGGTPVGISVKRTNASESGAVQGSLYSLSRGEYERLRKRLGSYKVEAGVALVRDYSSGIDVPQKTQAVIFTRKDASVFTSWAAMSYIQNINEARKEVWGYNAWDIGIDSDGTVVTGDGARRS